MTLFCFLTAYIDGSVPLDVLNSNLRLMSTAHIHRQLHPKMHVARCMLAQCCDVTSTGSRPRPPNMASAHVAEMVGWDCAIEYLYKMLLCSACLPLAAAVLLGSLPLLFFPPWGILYMALVTWLTN